MPQLRFFSERYRCISAARGYPPSSVPERREAYSQRQAVRDALDVLDALNVDRAHVVGLSMGGFCAFHLGLEAPERVFSLAVAAVGYGAEPDRLSKIGHTLNLEEPRLFNLVLDTFLRRVADGSWRPENVSAGSESVMGVGIEPSVD